MFLFFSVARSASLSQVERASAAVSAKASAALLGIQLGASEVERLPTDKLVDISALALRMSSPFNAGYWLANA
ncbi:MAG: hypothetical protein KBG58_05615 [Giesbergeria sp.]|nr:hypothetical protein [Giesbergeria sp.]MBP6321377.1 hypothetical protein [Giesbergeria sp.]MBP7916542.1 hypothetical protein [Giesbergeria sp.]MBP8029195.1 hypothetical protein [Giesbergeria sp.]MBP8840120.1 hypothetical protein [Giesbergeria sp.]